MIARATLRRLRSHLRYHLQYPAEYRLGLVKTMLRRAQKPEAETTRILLVSDGIAYTDEQQFAPLRRYAALLRDRLGVVCRFMRLSDGLRLGPSAFSRYEAVGLKLFFRTPDSEVTRVIRHFRERTSASNTRLIYFDGGDDVCVQWPEALRGVDLYVKKGIFTSNDNYLREFVGKTNLTHYVWTEYGIAPSAADIPKSGVLEPEELNKLHLGWSIALDDKIAQLLRKVKPPPAAAKDVDIVCRASVPADWLFSLRNIVIQRLEPLKARYRVLAPTHRVTEDQYYDEMRSGRICISPIGYGEVCWRDFEAIICGCLLIKPDISHLRSHPDIFVPGETYIPVRWDYADLDEKVTYYLDRETERARICENAYRVLADYYRSDGFVSSFAGLLDRIGLPMARNTVPSGTS